MLPNSIERTAPILGYDPHAFIMGKKSNFNGLHYPTREGGLDYFEKNPERIYTSREKGKKRFNLKSIFKGVLTIGGIIAGGAAIVKIKKIPAINTGNPITKGIKTAGGFISSKTSSAGGSISGALHGAGSFISNKFHAAGGFIKRKFSRP